MSHFSVHQPIARRLGAAAAVGAVSLALAGCGSSSKAATATDTSTTAVAAVGAAPTTAAVSTAGASPTTVDLSGVTLKVGVFPATGWDVELKAAGLSKTPYHVDYVTLDSGSLQLQSIDAGTVDVGSSSSIPPIFASQTTNQGNFKVVAASEGNTLNQVTLVPKGSSIATAADLKGKKVGYVPNTTAEYFLLRQLQSAGLTFKDITPVQLSTSQGLSALLGGSIAAFADYGTTVIAGEAQGAKVLADGGPILAAQTGGLVGAVDAAAPDLTNPAKAAAIADFIARVNASYTWARAHAQQWAQIESDATNQPVAQALQQFTQGEAEKHTTIGPTDANSIAAEQAIADTFHTAGILTTPVTASTFWTTQLNAAISADEAAYS